MHMASMRVRVRAGSPRDAAETSVVWKEGLLDAGLTSHGIVQSAGRRVDLMRGVAFSMGLQHARKATAAAASRDARRALRSELSAHGLAYVASPATLAGQQSAELDSALRRVPADVARAVWDAVADLRRLRRARMWAVLVVEVEGDGARAGMSGASGGSSSSSSGFVGYCVVSLSQPLAVLPPPFPSATPLCLHIDGLAVLSSTARHGLGTQLLLSVERLARAWGRRSIWLHVDEDNEPACRLYASQGYAPVRTTGGWWTLTKRQLVMRKDLPAARRQGAAVVGAARAFVTSGGGSAAAEASVAGSSSGGGDEASAPGQGSVGKKGVGAAGRASGGPQSDAGSGGAAAAAAGKNKVYVWGGDGSGGAKEAGAGAAGRASGGPRSDAGSRGAAAAAGKSKVYVWGGEPDEMDS
ncbi:hypothetical protein FOA52_002867 [Chlamydomonas sp. UWO 241]|nr:hypothetical protein FOA52_002867 [Chlamydomonas sp. UWO 241]